MDLNCRVKFKIDDGDGGNEEMRQRIRAQANFVEYVPIALILLMLVGALTVLGRGAKLW